MLGTCCSATLTGDPIFFWGGGGWVWLLHYFPMEHPSSQRFGVSFSAVSSRFRLRDPAKVELPGIGARCVEVGGQKESLRSEILALGTCCLVCWEKPSCGCFHKPIVLCLIKLRSRGGVLALGGWLLLSWACFRIWFIRVLLTHARSVVIAITCAWKLGGSGHVFQNKKQETARSLADSTWTGFCFFGFLQRCVCVCS